MSGIAGAGTRIAIVGTGANGAGIGADLINAGLDVTFIEQWPAHVDAMRERGIRVNLPDGRSTVTPVTVFNLCEVATLRQPFDVVLVLVKAYDTRWACELIRPLLKPSGIAVGLQNGMTLDDMADVLGPERTLGAVIEISSNMFEPGVVNRQSPRDRSWFAIGSFSPATHGREQDIADILGHAGTVEISDDIRSSKWMKLVVNAAELAPSAVLGLPLGAAARIPGMLEIMVEAGNEAMRTAIALGNRARPIFGLDDVDVTEPEKFSVRLLDRVLTHYTLDDTKTTILQDWIKGRRGEAEEINGLVVREQERLGGSAPVNALVVGLARRIEAGTLTADPVNAELLLAAHLVWKA